MLVLLLAQLDFARQAFGDGVGQGIEFIEEGDDAGLLIQWWHRNFQIPQITHWQTNHRISHNFLAVLFNYFTRIQKMSKEPRQYLLLLRLNHIYTFFDIPVLWFIFNHSRSPDCSRTGKKYVASIQIGATINQFQCPLIYPVSLFKKRNSTVLNLTNSH